MKEFGGKDNGVVFLTIPDWCQLQDYDEFGLTDDKGQAAYDADCHEYRIYGQSDSHGRIRHL